MLPATISLTHRKHESSMPKFSISTLLWIVCACAIIIAIVITQRTLRQNNLKLSAALNDVSKYRDESGKLDVDDPGRYHIRHFKDRYTSDTEFRWRIYVPDASNCSIFYTTGILPADGFPQKRQALISSRLPAGPAELVLIVENREDSGGPGDFRIGFYPEHRTDNSAPIQGIKMRSVDWMPWFRNKKCTYENPPFDTTSSFELDQPFVIMKHYTTRDNGELAGYMFWMEQSGTPVAPR